MKPCGIAVLVSLLLWWCSPSTTGQEKQIKLPEGTIYVDLSAKGEVRVREKKEPLRTSEEINSYLKAEYPQAKEKAQTASGPEARPIIVLRIREVIEDKPVAALKSLCNAADYRVAIDKHYKEVVTKNGKPPKVFEEQPGRLIVAITKKGEFILPNQRTALGSVAELNKHLKSIYPALKKETEKGGTKKAEPSLVLMAELDDGLKGMENQLKQMDEIVKDTGFPTPIFMGWSNQTVSIVEVKSFELEK